MVKRLLHSTAWISLLQDGGYLSVMGPSGSGKSTLFNLIGLLDKPDAGEYVLGDMATSHLAEEARVHFLRRDHMGLCFSRIIWCRV